MYKIKTLKSKNEWLKNRKIGGSTAACILDMNPFKSKQELYHELIGDKVVEDLSDNAAINFGKNAEDLVRRFFALKYAEDYSVIAPKTIEQDGYIELYYKSDKPFMTATIDGTLIDKKTNKKGVLEIKTCTVMNSAKNSEWKNAIPNNYYCQILHYLAVLNDYDFAVVYACLMYQDGTTIFRPYFYTRESLQKEIDYIEFAETKFYEDSVKKLVEPPFVLKI